MLTSLAYASVNPREAIKQRLVAANNRRRAREADDSIEISPLLVSAQRAPFTTNRGILATRGCGLVRGPRLGIHQYTSCSSKTANDCKAHDYHNP
jgi:hypothetical protein